MSCLLSIGWCEHRGTYSFSHSSFVWIFAQDWNCWVTRKLGWTPLGAQTVKRLPTMWETRVLFLGQEDSLEEETAPHSSTLAWKIPRMEDPGRLQSMGSQRVRHD